MFEWEYFDRSVPEAARLVWAGEKDALSNRNVKNILRF